MKKNFLIFGVALIVLSFTAYGFMNSNEVIEEPLDASVVEEKMYPETKKEFEVFEDFIYEIGPRFGGITKEELQKATSIKDFIPEEQINWINRLKLVSVIIFKDEKRSDIRANGNTIDLNQEQLELIQSFDVSTSFVINAEYLQINHETGQLEGSQSTPHLTVVPVKQATYLFGMDALAYFLKENTEEVRVGVDPKKLKPAKLSFTVTKDGTIKNAQLDRSSNYPKVD
ncbi:MAG: hypothetical protein KUG68_12680, partial [Flavobacteriaceae bacterium]|nr:hypothetical protein [Flavobacteriaceae bacterium]